MKTRLGRVSIPPVIRSDKFLRTFPKQLSKYSLRFLSFTRGEMGFVGGLGRGNGRGLSFYDHSERLSG